MLVSYSGKTLRIGCEKYTIAAFMNNRRIVYSISEHKIPHTTPLPSPSIYEKNIIICVFIFEKNRYIDDSNNNLDLNHNYRWCVRCCNFGLPPLEYIFLITPDCISRDIKIRVKNNHLILKNSDYMYDIA